MLSIDKIEEVFGFMLSKLLADSHYRRLAFYCCLDYLYYEVFSTLTEFGQRFVCCLFLFGSDHLAEFGEGDPRFLGLAIPCNDKLILFSRKLKLSTTISIKFSKISSICNPTIAPNNLFKQPKIIHFLACYSQL